MSGTISLLSGLIEAEEVSSGMPVLIVGVQDGENIDVALVIDENGNFTWDNITNLRTPWRYNFDLGEWVEQKESNGTEDDSPDGGEGVPGSIPELDEFSEGDPLDTEGRQAAGGFGYVDTGEDQ